MPCPKKKHTRSHTGMRRAHDALKKVSVQNCPNCGSISLPHHVCPSCGYYKKRELLHATTA